MFWIVFVSQAPLLFFSFCGGGDAEANQQFKKNKKNSRNTSKKKKDQKAILKTCPVSSLVQQEKHRLAFFLHFIYLFLSQTTYFFSFSPPSFLPPLMTLFVSRYSFHPPCFYSSLTPPLFFFLPPSLSYSLFMSHSDSLSLPLYISHPASLFSPCYSLSIYLSLFSLPTF